jgi:MFS family permease
MGGGVLRQRDVQLIVGAVGVSALGDWLLFVPLTLQLQEMNQSGIVVAALLICLWAPIVLLAPVAGLVADRVETRKVLICASLAQALAAGALAFALDAVWAILLLAALLGIGFAFAQPAEFALVPAIGKGERLGEINGYVESARYVGMTLGPLLGGVLAAAGGTQVAMVVNAVTFVAVSLAAALLTARRVPSPRSEGEHERVRDGVVHLFRDPTLGLVVGVVFVALLFMTATATAEVFFLKEDLAVGDALYGLLFSCWTVAMVVGALAVSRRVPAQLVAVAALVAVGVQGAGIALPAVWLAAAFCGAMWVVGGIGHGTKNVLTRTLIQERVPDHLHGRVFAAYNGLRNGAELVALAAGGLLVAAIGARATLLFAGGIPVLTAIVGLVLYRRRARTGAPQAAAEPAAP